jgi:hypothetical protein
MYPSKPPRRSLPPDALRYARDQLWVARGLGPHLDRHLTADEWSSWTFADLSVPESRLERFSEGGAINSVDVESDVWREVATTMAGNAPAAWLVPDPLGRPTDPFLRDVDVEYFVMEDAVYYVERSGEIERLAATWRQASSAAGQMGLVTTYDLPASELDAADLRFAAGHAVLLAMSAYDGDGILLFEKPES